PRTPDAAEAGVAQARIGGGLHPRAGAVADAVLVAAEEGAAAGDAFWRAGLVGVIAALRALRIASGADRVVIRPVPVRDPFPNVARHVEEAVAVRQERGNRRGAAESVFSGVVVREV